MMSMRNFIELAGNAAEALGVLLILGGFVVAAARFVPLRARSDTSAYLRLRHDLGRAILLGLEVLVAADIIRTVAFTPDLNGVIILAIIVAIRTFLSWSLGLELEGRWPWQRPVVEGAHDIIGRLATVRSTGTSRQRPR
jgi:uncharacterized membrane protein